MHINQSLIRRRLKSPNVRVKAMNIGSMSHTVVSVMYIEGIADPLCSRFGQCYCCLKWDLLASSLSLTIVDSFIFETAKGQKTCLPLTCLHSDMERDSIPFYFSFSPNKGDELVYFPS
ncbi:spore germination protein [Laceyella putida]